MQSHGHVPSDITASGPYRYAPKSVPWWKVTFERSTKATRPRAEVMSSCWTELSNLWSQTLNLQDSAVADEGEASSSCNGKVFNATNKIIPLHQKPLRSESHWHSLSTDIAQENLQAKGILVLLWPGLSTCCSSEVGLLSLFSEEGKRHGVSKTSKENCEVARIGSWKQYHIPHVLLSVSVLLQSVFLTLFFPSSLLLIKLFSACKRPGQLVDSQNLRPEESTVSH